MASIVPLLTELMDIASTVTSFGDRKFTVFSMDELRQKAEGAGFPMIAVGFEEAMPADNTNAGINAQGRTAQPCDVVPSDIRFTIIVGVEYNWATVDNSNTNLVALNLLDEVRGKLQGYSGVNPAPWRWAGDQAVPSEIDGVIFYAQQWETRVVLKGDNA